VVTLVLGVVVIFAVIFVGLYVGDAARPAGAAPSLKERIIRDYTLKPSQAASPEEVWIWRSERQMAALEQQNRRLEQQLHQLQRSVQNLDSYPRIATVEPIPPPPSSIGSGPGSVGSGRSAALPPPPSGRHRNPLAGPKPRAPQGARPKDTMASRQMGANTAIPHGQQETAASTIRHIVVKADGTGAKGKKRKSIHHYLPPGTIATAVLISGLDAPTGGLGQSNPMPVLMRVMHPGSLPNRAGSDLKHCHVIGAAYGDISSERAMVRLENIACVLKNDEVVEAKVKGYVAGEDGKSGFRGRLVSKQGAMIARALVAGVASGVSSAITQQYRSVAQTAFGTVSSVDPQRIGELGLATGASNALEKIADYYIARANETYPVIEIASNRIGEIILTDGADLEADFVGNTRQEAK
jgi:conjugal transfer pilus assembly protein TraB